MSKDMQATNIIQNERDKHYNPSRVETQAQKLAFLSDNPPRQEDLL